MLCIEEKLLSFLLLGQFLPLQPSLSTLDPNPEQSLPPYCGGGFVHVRDLKRVPLPHATEQELH